MIRLTEADRYQDVPGFGFGQVFDQDTGNFVRRRAGIKASHKGRQTLASYHEVRIRHLHQTLAGYLHHPPAADVTQP